MSTSDRMPGEQAGSRFGEGDGCAALGQAHAVPDAAGELDDAAAATARVAGVARGESIPPTPLVSHKVRRQRRDRPRGKTIAMKRLSIAELRLGAAMYPPVELARPQTRADCGAEARPCPWVACKHHLYLDINPETGSIKINFPDREPWELEHTCALDVAEAGGKTLDEIGQITNLTRERIRQVEVRGLLKLRARRELR